MTKYLIKRLLHGIVSIIIVVFIVMLLVFLCTDRELALVGDTTYSRLKGNDREVYKYKKLEDYGYIDYVKYGDYLDSLNLTGEERKAAELGDTSAKDSATAKKYIKDFEDYYKSKGYEVVRLNKGSGAGQTKQYFAYRDINIMIRFGNYLAGIFNLDNIHKAKGIPDDERGLTFTLHDPAYGGEKFAPAIIGNGTQHKYLLYFDNKFPFVHQNLFSISLGTSFTVNRNVDVWDTMTNTQGDPIFQDVVFPTGYTESSASNLHSAVYVYDSLETGGEFAQTRFVDDYTGVITYKNGMSQMGYSFVIGIISTIIAYVLGLPLGILMARNKDKFIDKLGIIYIIFIIAVPSLAYIFMFKAIGGLIGMPTTFITGGGAKYYLLPIISLALPSIGGLMKWMRRYMIDQSNSDYVKFARSGGLTERQIFSKHIMKNAAIPILHGIPGSILGALTGAIITERVYVVPGVGNVLTQAINKYDNNVIVGVTMFYAVLSVLSLILGDLMMALVDPRISFTSKAR